MSEMVERVARAIYERDEAGAGTPVPWDDAGPLTVAHAYNVARAAIEAMRIPTKEMVDAGMSEISDVTVSDPKASAWDAMRFYRAMIDAALSEVEG